MKNKLYLLLITVMACFALSACGDSDEGTKEMKTYEYDNSGDVVIENDSLKLSVSGSSTQLEVTDKATGKVYRSNPTAEDVEKYANADGTLLTPTILIRRKRLITILSVFGTISFIKLRK